MERLTLMGILADCERACADYGVTIAEAFEDVKLKRRSEPIVWARWTLFRILADRGWSCNAIGRACGMHHTTVADALRKSFVPPAHKKSPRALGPGGRTVAPAGGEESTTKPDSGQRNFDRAVCECGQVGCEGSC